MLTRLFVNRPCYIQQAIILVDAKILIVFFWQQLVLYYAIIAIIEIVGRQRQNTFVDLCVLCNGLFIFDLYKNEIPKIDYYSNFDMELRSYVYRIYIESTLPYQTLGDCRLYLQL